MTAKEEYYEQIANGLNKMGIDNFARSTTALTLSEVVGSDAIDFEDIKLAEFEDYLDRIMSYNIYLKSQKGSIEAQVIVLESEYSRLMGLETQTVERPHDGGFLSKDEKEASALLQSEKLVELRHDIVVAKAKLSKVKDIPYAIDKKVDILRLKYKRRYQLAHGYRDQG